MNNKIAAGFILAALVISKLHGQINLSGRVVDEKASPLEFATVVLKQDSAIFHTAFTDSLGYYRISCDTGKYILQFYYTGYRETKYAIHISRDTSVNVVLDTNSQNLSEVIVLGNAASLERKADRFVYSVANSEITKGNTILDVLKQTPLVKVDENTGTVNIINKSRTVIYINGKKSNLTQEAILSLLKNTSAEDLLRFEIITIPSSTYTIEGNAGIIDIVMKKNKTNHLNGLVRLSDGQAHYNSQYGSANFNYRKNKLGINANAYCNHLQQYNINRTNILFKHTYYKQEMSLADNQTPKLFSGGTLGIDYDLNEKQTIGMRMDCSFNSITGTSTAISRYKLASNNIYDSLQRTANTSQSYGSEIALNGNYRYSFDSVGSFFTADVDYLTYLNSQTNYNATDLINENSETLSPRERFKQIVPQKIHSVSSRLEYNRSFSQKNSLSIGANGFLTRNSNDTYFGNLTNGDYLRDSLQSFYYKYDESVAALFATYSRTWNNQIQSAMGIRMENTQNNGKVTSSGLSFANNYRNLLPYLSFSYAQSEKSQFSYTFSSRIARPAFWELNPFRYYLTSNFYVENNPFLQPQKMYINEVSYVLNNKYTFLVDYTHTDNASAQFQTVEGDFVKMVRLNFGVINDASVSISTQPLFHKDAIKTNLSISSGMTKYSGRTGYLIINNVGYYFAATANNTITISKETKWFAFVNLYYSSPTITQNGFIKSTNSVCIGIKKRFQRWSVSLWGDDIFRGSTLRFNIEDVKMRLTELSYYDTRNIFFTIGYSFGNQNLKINREQETSNTEIKNRSKR